MCVSLVVALSVSSGEHRQRSRSDAVFKDMTTDCEQVLMSDLNPQPVSCVTEADESSFQLHQTGVLTAT